MLVALVYWRRKVVERHFVAWKEALFFQPRTACRYTWSESPKRQTQQYRTGPKKNALLRRATRPEASSIDPSDTRLYTHNQGRDRVYRKTLNEQSSHDSTVQSLRRRYRDLKCSETTKAMNVNQRDHEMQSSEEKLSELRKRREFRESLRLAYLCMSAWKAFVARETRKMEDFIEMAKSFDTVRTTRAIFHAWKARLIYQMRVQRLEEKARLFLTIRIKRVFVSRWKRYWKVQREICRRSAFRDIAARRLFFDCWKVCVERQRRIHIFQTGRYHRICQNVIRRFREYRAVKMEEESIIDMLKLRRNSHLIRAIFVDWRNHVLTGPKYILAQRATRIIPMGSAIRKWKRFLMDRRKHVHRQLQADYFRHESNVRQAFKAWHVTHLQKRHIKIDFQRAQLHYEQYLKTTFVKALRRIHNIKQLRAFQCENASVWQATRSKRIHFKRWFYNVRFISRLTRFQSQARDRRMSQIIEAWKCWKCKHSTLHKMYAVVLNHNSESTLRVAVLVWTNALRVKLKVKTMQLKMQQACVQDHLKAWLHCASKTRRHRRQVVEFREKMRSMVLVRSFTQWLGVVLRNKCMRRLVRLFQKKTSKKNLKAAFQLLNDNRRECKIQRITSRSRLHRFMTHWASEMARLRVKRSQLAMADCFYSGHRYAIAVQQWLHVVHLERVVQDNERRALTFFFRRIMRNTLHSWYCVARRCRRRTHFLREKRAELNRQAQQQYLYAWYRFVQCKTKRRLAHWRAWKFRTLTAYFKCFRGWRDLVVDLKTWRIKWEETVLLYQKRACRNVFAVWKKYANRNIIHRRNQAKISCLVARRKSRQSIYDWFDFIHERKWLRQQKYRAIKFYDEFLLYSMLYRWQKTVENRLVLHETTTMATNRIIQTRLARTIRQWVQLLAAKGQLKTKTVLVTQAKILKAITRWKSTHKERQAVKQRNHRVTKMYRCRQLIKVLRAWRQYQASVKALKYRLQLIFQNDNALVLRSAFHWWTRYRSTATLERIAITHRDRKLRGKIWNSWVAHRGFVQKMKKNVLVSTQLLRSNTSKAVFFSWKVFVDERLSRRKMSIQAKRHYEMTLCQGVLNGLKWSLHFRALQTQAFATRDRNRLAKYFKLWIKFSIYVHAAREKNVRANQFLHVKRLKRAFNPWRDTVQKITAIKEHKSAAYCRVLYWKWAWMSWYRLIEWRMKVERMQAKHIENLRVFSFRSWKAFARRRRSSKRTNLQAIQISRSRNLDRVWCRWQKFVLNRRQKNQQLARVLCFYSVDILERRCFRNWQSFLCNRRQLWEKMQYASEMNDHFAVRTMFRNWNLYVKHRQNRVIEKASQCMKIQQAALSRSIMKWNCRKEKSRHLKSCMTNAIAFHQRRYLGASLSLLQLFSQAKKDERLNSKSAAAFHKNKVLRSSFQTWSAYHQWRNRYRKIVHLFHANRQSDYFEIWTRFCALQRCSREKKDRAKAFWRVRNLRQSFRDWLRFRYLHQMKHRAVRQYTDKLVHTMLLSWKRRAHVLRQMRKMLCFQESFFLMNHFASWKRFVSMKQMQLRRLQGATHFMSHNRLNKCWLKWTCWILHRREEKKTIQLAVGFRRRFFSWKCFGMWRERVAWWKRKRMLRLKSTLLLKTNRLRCVWNGLLMLWLRKRDLLLRSVMANAGLVALRQKRFVDRLRLQHNRHKHSTQNRATASAHWKCKLQLKCWEHLADWSAQRRHRNKLHERARQHLNVTQTRRCMTALQAYVAHMQHLRSKAHSFRLRYFRSTNATYFAQWKAFAVFRRQLRGLRHLQTRRRLRRVLVAWRATASTRARHHLLLCDALETRRARLLRQWFLHWESVGTDQWTFARLIEHHQRQQLHRSARRAVQHWRQQLQLWRNRQRWNQTRRQRHAHTLRRMLRHWHSSSCA